MEPDPASGALGGAWIYLQDLLCQKVLAFR
jgi:hypothetical protein